MSKVNFFDPHFHIWDINDESKSRHCSKTLFAPHNNKIYSVGEYEKDCDSKGVVKHIGGVWVEAMSVHYPQQSGQQLQDACIAESAWCSKELEQSKRSYVLCPSACLEAKNVLETLTTLCKDHHVRGIRQIVNHEPNWPRNGVLGDLLDNKQWIEGFKILKDFNLSFDLQCNPHQLHKAAALIKANKDTTVIINHFGCPKLEDLTDPATSAVFWDGMDLLSKCPNVYLKLSMHAYTDKHWDKNVVLLNAIHKAIALFGSDRCLFATNYPVDLLDGFTQDRLYAAFLSIASKYSLSTQKKLFSENAQKAYRVCPTNLALKL